MPRRVKRAPGRSLSSGHRDCPVHRTDAFGRFECFPCGAEGVGLRRNDALRWAGMGRSGNSCPHAWLTPRRERCNTLRVASATCNFGVFAAPEQRTFRAASGFAGRITRSVAGRGPRGSSRSFAIGRDGRRVDRPSSTVSTQSGRPPDEVAPWLRSQLATRAHASMRCVL